MYFQGQVSYYCIFFDEHFMTLIKKGLKSVKETYRLF